MFGVVYHIYKWFFCVGTGGGDVDDEVGGDGGGWGTGGSGDGGGEGCCRGGSSNCHRSALCVMCLACCPCLSYTIGWVL